LVVIIHAGILDGRIHLSGGGAALRRPGGVSRRPNEVLPICTGVWVIFSRHVSTRSG
jgi:hypothetical protein